MFTLILQILFTKEN